MRFSVPAVVFGLCAAFAATSPVPEPSATPPAVDKSKVYIEGIDGITYAGSGCKAGSVAISMNDPKTVVTLAFDSYMASIGPTAVFTDKRKNCNLNIKLHYPPGYQYTLYQLDYTGHADLDKDVKATQRSTYWFAGEQPRATLQTSWVGKFSDNFSLRDTLVNKSWVWSPCGASTTLNINTEVFLDNSKNPKGSGLITTDVIDGKVVSLFGFGFQFRPCQ
jgi:hypothetical protein